MKKHVTVNLIIYVNFKYYILLIFIEIFALNWIIVLVYYSCCIYISTGISRNNPPHYNGR